MKNKWLISSILIGCLSGSAIIIKKIKNKTRTKTELLHENLIKFFLEEGYKVHIYNEQSDLILFHQDKNEKRHVFLETDAYSKHDFSKKLDTYYHHFTNTFYFVASTEEKKQTMYNDFKSWEASLGIDIASKYGKPRAYLYTIEELIDKKEEW